MPWGRTALLGCLLSSLLVIPASPSPSAEAEHQPREHQADQLLQAQNMSVVRRKPRLPQLSIASPTAAPVASPTIRPTTSPTVAPGAGPTVSPAAGPTTGPTVGPTTSPVAVAGTLGSQVRFGAFAGGFTSTGSQVAQFEQQLGSRLSIASSFRGVGDVFPAGEQLTDAASGHTLLISWDMGSTVSQRFSTYTKGGHDTYLRSVAAAARGFGAPIYLRPWAEMNGDWSTFQPTTDGSRPAGGTPGEFKAAWQHVVTVFRAAGATNVRWVFNPTTDTYAETTDIRTIFPGSNYVDVLGLDGYNWGTGGVFTWRSFADIYTVQYQRLLALAPTLPVWVCEVGSKQPLVHDGSPIDPANSKAAWYKDALSSKAFPAITALVMFDIRKERDWRVGSDPATLQTVAAAVRAGMG